MSRDFLKLWTGQTISEVGSRISREGLPITAALLLDATPFQMGVLAATGGASVLLFGLVAGVLTDRHRRKPILIGADAGRALLLFTIPMAAAGHALFMPQLLAVAAMIGVLTVLFDVAYQSYVPGLVGPAGLLEANRRLAMSGSAAEIVGPALAGVLIRIVTAPIAILADGVSFLVSAAAVWRIGQVEPPPEPHSGRPLREELLEGARLVSRHPVLRLLALRDITAFLSMGAFMTLYVLFALRELRLSTPAFGFTIALGGIGSLAGAWMTTHLARRFRPGPTLLVSAVLTACVNLLIPLAASFPSLAVPLLGTAQLIGDAGWAVYMVTGVTYRQRVTEAAVLGRVNAAMQLASRGVLPLGALVAGWIASTFGMPATLWAGALGVLISCLWLAPLVSEPDAS